MTPAWQTALGGVFAARGYRPVEPPLLQPADVFLDRLGDEVRSRIYVFTDPGGTELCLRPELTIPVCRTWLAEGAKPGSVARLCYMGPVFRYVPGDPAAAQSDQAGIEFLGLADREAADGEVLALTIEALAAAGASVATLRMGDLGLFAALIEAVDLPAQWRGRLLRHFSRPDRFARVLGEVSTGGPARGGPRGLLATLGRLDEPEARAVIADVLALADIRTVGGRTIEEITERLLEQAADASALALPRPTVALIEAFLDIADTPDKALPAMRALARDGGLAIGPALDRFERRLALLAARGIAPERLHFATSFGRTMDYYTGFVFEILGAGGRKLAAGGRYDGLLSYLGAPGEIAAVGAAIDSAALGPAGALP